MSCVCKPLQYRAMQASCVMESLLAYKLASIRALRATGGLPAALFGMPADVQASLGLAGDVDERWADAAAHMKRMELRLLPTNQVRAPLLLCWFVSGVMILSILATVTTACANRTSGLTSPALRGMACPLSACTHSLTHTLTHTALAEQPSLFVLI
jgi:hypothetical protein